MYLGGGICGLGTCVFVFIRKRGMWIGYMYICVYKEEGYADWVHVYLCL